MKLLEIYESLLDEDYPMEFDIEVFKKLNSFNKRIKYCEAKLHRIASGSARIVYMVDDEKVLKLAKNQKGLAQNEIEIGYGQEGYLEDIVAKIFDYDGNDLWVEMELAKKLRVSDFKTITGYNFSDFQNAVLKYGNESNSRRNKDTSFRIDDALYQDMWENEFTYGIFNFIGNYDIPVGDLARLNSYGKVKRDGEDAIVLIDYGLTHEVYDSYYS